MLRCSALLSLISGLLFLSCKKDVKIETPVPAPDKAPQAVFNFEASVNGRPLGPGTYTNAAQDSFTVSKFNYYISNIKFKRADGSVYAEPESYHLNQHLAGRESFTVTHLPEGTYTDIEFTIGVDSARNVSGSQTGALDVGQGMFWDWNTGYVFFKIEGLCKTANNPIWKDYTIHVGGFSKPYNCLQTCKVHLSRTLVAKKNRQSVLTWHVHVDEVFTRPDDLSFDKYLSVSGGKLAPAVADNYKDMFELSGIEN